MGLSSAGIGSNLDVEGIVSKLMSVEQQPLLKLAKQETSYQIKLSGFGTLKGALSQFQSAVRGLSDISKFQGMRSSTSDASVASVSSTSAATPGAYSLKVTQLAQTQKLVAGGTASDSAPIGKGVISFDFGTITDPGTTYNSTTGKYGVGTTFQTGGTGIKTVTIDDTNNSLAGIRDAINKAAIGVTATIVNDGGASTPYRLALTSNVSGVEKSMKISVANTAPDTGLSALLNHDPAAVQGLSQTSTAQNALFTVDGILVSKASNKVSDVIDGVTLNLLKESPTTATTITVERDTTAVTASVNAFVKAYNDISQTLRDAAAYNATTKTAAILNGEASVRSIESQVRSVLMAPVAGGASAFSRLSEIGVTMQKDGLLAVDSTKLSTAMSSNFADFAGLFAAAGKSSDSLVSYSSASAATKPGAYALEVTRMASKGSSAGTAPVTSLNITSSNNTLDVLLDGVSATITLTAKIYGSASELAAEIQSKVNGVAAFSAAGSAVAVSESTGTLTVTSNRYGSASAFSISGGSGMANLNFASSGSSVLGGLDVAGTINGAAATGSGQILTGAAGGDTAGLAITIDGGSTGSRGTVNFSRGYAYQLDKLSTSLLASDGPLTARTNGLDASIKSLTKSKEALGLRLGTIEKRLRAQFTALDLVISRMNSTNSFLTQQLDQLSRLSSGQ
ncbi:MAG: flagellar filament capping protein FliD [Telluria sp.]|nr:flagellar filament capping protein FliD [Telluria sp.]